MKDNFINTEINTASYLNEIDNFSFSMNRSGDWANLLVIHKNNEKPTLFSTDQKSILK